MKSKIKVIILVCSALNACAPLAPLSNVPTARTIGKSKIHIEGGAYYPEDYYGKLGYGITDDVDLYLLMEKGAFNENIGAAAKFSVLNSREGESISIDGSAGTADDGYYGYLGATISYKKKWFEPYAIGRYNLSRVSYSGEYDFYGKNHYKGDMTFQYGQVTMGSTFWFDQHFGAILNANYLFGDVDGLVFGAGLILRP